MRWLASDRATKPVTVPEVEQGRTIRSHGPSKRLPKRSFTWAFMVDLRLLYAPNGSGRAGPRLATASVKLLPGKSLGRCRYNRKTVDGKTFYIETFGCQMNAHDSEKVVGTLLEKGYSQVETTEEAHLVLYNTCSIRDKAEQKVFNRLQNFKREAGKGKVFGVLGCVAQQEGEKIFE